MLLVQFLVILIIGYLIGLMQGGIKINIEQKTASIEEVKPVESLVGELPPEVVQYYNKTNGQNRF